MIDVAAIVHEPMRGLQDTARFELLGPLGLDYSG
jgi:hypothetical protein